MLLGTWLWPTYMLHGDLQWQPLSKNQPTCRAQCRHHFLALARVDCALETPWFPLHIFWLSINDDSQESAFQGLKLGCAMCGRLTCC